MNVISGSLKGHKLKSFSNPELRPTAQRVKEAVFSIVQMYISDALVLDLFAGTGQMGIEALSRGAEHCVFVDHDRKSKSLIFENLTSAKLTSKADILFCDTDVFF